MAPPSLSIETSLDTLCLSSPAFAVFHNAPATIWPPHRRRRQIKRSFTTTLSVRLAPGSHVRLLRCKIRQVDGLYYPRLDQS